MNQKIINKNIIFILLIGIEGMAFGLIDWNCLSIELDDFVFHFVYFRNSCLRDLFWLPLCLCLSFITR